MQPHQGSGAVLIGAPIPAYPRKAAGEDDFPLVSGLLRTGIPIPNETAPPVRAGLDDGRLIGVTRTA